MTPIEAGGEPEVNPIGARTRSASESLSLVLALAGYALLADAVVETYWNGSPGKLWVAGAAAIYATLSALLWRRISWKAKAVSALLTLLAIAALASWLPNGTTNGLYMLGQPTPRVLAAAGAIGVALAGIALWQVRRIPLVLRVALGVLAAYGVAAFLIAMFAGTRLDALLGGASLWQRLPQVLFEWVRDNTDWIPYRGVLRGPIGVLMDREGNSLDRALLLAALLENAGYSVRLAHGELTREQSEQLLPELVVGGGLGSRHLVRTLGVKHNEMCRRSPRSTNWTRR